MSSKFLMQKRRIFWKW